MNLHKLIDYFQVDKREFLFQFQSHPNYPSALAFSDTLNFLGIKNDAYELGKEYWEELPEEFITIYKDNFALVHRNGNQAKIFADKEETVTFNDLKDNSGDFILLFEKNNIEKTAKPNSVLYLVILFLALAIVLINNVIHWNLWSFLFQILSLAGVYLFSEIFKEKLGTESFVLQSFCGAGAKQHSLEAGCNKIIKSKNFQFLELKFSDFGFVYFIAISILPLLISKGSILFLGLASLSFFGIIYSVYYQITQKTFCKVCGLVIGILLAQFAISYFYFSETFSISELLVTLFSFLMILFLIHYISKTIEEKEKYRKENIKTLRFKRNYELFKRELLNNEQVIFKNPKAGFFFGNENAKIHLTLISNPYCGFCKDAHHLLENILKKYKDEVSLQVRFNFEENADHPYQELISAFDFLYKEQKTKMLEAVALWYNNRDLQMLKNKFNLPTTIISLNDYVDIGNENNENQFNFTPTILINGYQFPKIYDREDIQYFFEDLIEDEDFY